MAVQVLAGEELANRLSQGVTDSVEHWEGDVVWVKPSSIDRVARFLRDDPDSDFQFLNSISAVDYVEYFEVVYHLTSLRRQHTAVVKSRVYGRESLSVPSVYDVWRGADFRNGKCGT